METQMIITLKNGSSDEESKLAAKKKKRYVIDLQTAKGKYNPNDSIKFQTGSIESSLCD